jgi:PIN domain nuclease of toxin-antitoxin system
MTLLLDTHFLLWIANGDQRLTLKAKKIISAADSVYMSAASLWEISIKVSVGKLVVDVDALTESLLVAGLVELPVSIEHTKSLKALLPIHRDPFDRMLVAQAMTEPMHLLTVDAALTAYGPWVKSV